MVNRKVRKLSSNSRRINGDGDEDATATSSKMSMKRMKQVDFDEDVSSVEADGDVEVDDRSMEDANDEAEGKETLDARKIRLAREYLDRMAELSRKDDSSSEGDVNEHEEEDDDDEVDVLARRLERERRKRSGTLERTLAKSVGRLVSSSGPPSDWVSMYRGHDLTVTCVALHESGSVAYSGSKDGSVLAWDVETGTRTAVVSRSLKKTDGAPGPAQAVACSDDGRYLAVGGMGRPLTIHDVRLLSSSSSSSSLKQSGDGSGSGHNKSVIATSTACTNTTALAFRPHTLCLYSGGTDRTVRRHVLDDLLLDAETLYGHGGPVTGLSCPVTLDRPCSVGRDRTVRSWKIREQTHLIFRPDAQTPSADAVAVCGRVSGSGGAHDDSRHFLTVHSEDGTVRLWTAQRKRPLCTRTHAVGVNCVDVLRGSDLAATGAADGCLRLWRIVGEHDQDGNEASDDDDHDGGPLRPIATLPLHGTINDIAMGPRGRFAVLAVGQEPRLGRWERVHKAKNRFCVVRLQPEPRSAQETPTDTPTHSPIP